MCPLANTCRLVRILVGKKHAAAATGLLSMEVSYSNMKKIKHLTNITQY